MARLFRIFVQLEWKRGVKAQRGRVRSIVFYFVEAGFEIDASWTLLAMNEVRICVQVGSHMNGSVF